MNPALKILIGAVMVIVGVFSSVTYFEQLVNLVQAGIGPLLVLVGAFVVWLESDEWKMRKEKDSREGLQQQFQTEEETTSSAEQTQEQVKEAVEQEGHTCEECGRTFDTSRGLSIHKAQKHD